MESLLLKYLNICISELEFEHQFYFDAVDVIDILKGVNLFYESPNGRDFQKHAFENQNRVVQALAFGGFLDNRINLLPPHQAELSEKLKNNIFDTSTPEKPLELFWKNDLKFFERFKELTVPYDKNFNKDIIEEWVNEKGEDIFKAIFFSYKVSWQERLVEVFENDYFHLEDYKIDDIEIYDPGLFNSLLQAFSNTKKRLDKSENNYRDVIALMYLAKQVKAFNKGKIKTIPIFFDSQKFIDIIPDSILNTHFRLKIPNTNFRFESENYALRQAKYFKIYSLLKFNHPFPNEDNKYRKFIDNQKFLINIKKTLENLKYLENVLGSQQKLNNDKAELEKKIENYLDYDFFKTILLKTFLDNEKIVNHILSDINNSQISEEAFIKLKEKVEEYLLQLDKEINDIVYWSAKTFREIERRVDHLIKVSDNLLETGRLLNIFYHYSLFRFFIPKKYQDSINILFSSDGLLSKNLDTYQAAKVSLWNLHFRTVNSSKNAIRKFNEEDLFKLFSSFWILNLHELISKIDINYDNLHHSLLMLKGACIDRAISEYKKENKDYNFLLKSLRRIISILARRTRENILDNNEYGEVRIALSYLYFQLWIQEGNELLLEHKNPSYRIKYSSNDNNYKAVRYAREAFDFFDRVTAKENKVRIYALNIYIYFIIDTAPHEEFQKIKLLRTEFINLKGIINDWHFRYDDTIARNFHRLSLMVPSKDSKLSNANIAVNILKDSLSKLKDIDGRDIKEVESYMLNLQNYIGELESNI